jgi:hypothetical protein
MQAEPCNDDGGSIPVADYFTHFSCPFDVGSVENAARAEKLYKELVADLDREEGAYPGFKMQADPDLCPGVLWIYGDDCGDPEHVIRFVLLCADAFDLQGVWAFTWAHICSEPRLDAFGGGAHVIDLGKRATVADLDCAAWVSRYVDARDMSAIEGSDGTS